MATMRWYLMLCVLTGTVCLARIDFQRLGANTYTDCYGGASLLNVTNITLNNNSPLPTDNISLNVTVNNPAAATANITVNIIAWTASLPTSISFNQTVNGTNGQVVNNGTNATFQSTSFQLNQFYANGSIPVTATFYNSTAEVACWTGSVNVTVPTPNPSDCLGGNSSLSVTSVTLNPSSPQINNTLNLTFIVQNVIGSNVTFNDINWTLTFNTSSPINSNLNLTKDFIVVYGTPQTLTGNNVTLNQSVSAGSYPYQFAFYENTTQVACWGGNVTIAPPPPPPKPTDCFGGNSKLNVSSVVLNPASPEVKEPIHLSFEVETELSGNVTFNNISWTLNFSTPIVSNVSLIPDFTLTPGVSEDLNGNNVTLTQTVSPGNYSYQLIFFENTTEIACWEGNVTVPQPSNPSSSSYIYFLGVAGLSILFLS